MSSFYALEATDLQGQKFDFDQLKGKVVLIVNTASKCGFTPQYAGLESLYEAYKEQGLVVIAFPCNQFGQQEPGDSQQINAFCQLNYGVSFPIMAKIDVNGANTHPVYQYLKSQPGGKGLLGDAIKWNFTKFLIDRQGEVFNRYAPTKTAKDIEGEIKSLL